MKNFIKLSELKLQKSELQSIAGGSGNSYQGPPQIVLRYAVYPLYGVILPQPEYGITAP